MTIRISDTVWASAALTFALCLPVVQARADWIVDVNERHHSDGQWVTLVPRTAASRPPIVPDENYLPLIVQACLRNGLDVELVKALIHVESRYQPAARSPKGALGLMQIMPATGARYGVRSAERLIEPAVNVDIGTRYLRDLHRMFDGRVDLVLAAYNAGEAAVARHGWQVPPYRETQDYVRRIMAVRAGEASGRRAAVSR